MKKIVILAPLCCAALCAVAALALLAPLPHAAPALALLDPDALGKLMFAGLLVNKAALEGVFFGLKTIFHNALDAAPSDWQQTAMRVPSGTSEEKYNWLSRVPMMRRWFGDKVIKALAAFRYAVVNDDWEVTVAVDRNDIADDRLGIYNTQAQDAGWSAAQLPDEIVAELKNNAFASECYDGQFFYDTDHPVGNEQTGITSVSNASTVALSAASRAAAKASYGLARTAIMTMRDDEGRPMGLMPDLLEVPPTLEDVAKTLVESDKLDDGTPNPYKGTARVVVNPRLTSSTQWMLHVTSRPVKPFIYQERMAPHFVQATDPESENVFMRREFLFGAEARAAGAYGLWQLSFGSTGAG